MEPAPLWAELVGWYGAFAILGAYAAHSLGWLDPKRVGHTRTYQLLNLTGALGIALISAVHTNWQPMVLNSAWAVIALAALARGPGPQGPDVHPRRLG